MARPRLSTSPFAPLVAGALLMLSACESGDGTSGPDPEPDAELGPCDLADDCPDDGRPTTRSELSAVYDSSRQRMIMWGGSTAISEQCAFVSPGGSNFQDETWVFHDRCGTWEQLDVPGPPPRSRHMMAYDAAGDRVLMFGGRFRQATNGNYTTYNDLWQFDLATDTWSELITNNAPIARVNGGFVVNPAGTKAYLFGGNISLSGQAYNAQNDIYELDLSTYEWTQLNPDGQGPSGRLFVSAVYDPARDYVAFTGGADETAFDLDALYYREMWAYDVNNNAWVLLHAGDDANVPAGRFWGRMVYDTENDRYLMFGGHDDTNLGNANDMWAFDPDNDEWTVLQLGDVYNRPANGVCDFPPDFTIVDKDAPERRNAHAMAFSEGSTCPGVIITMGKTDCGATDDVHRWRVDTDEWEELLAANQGEMCERADRGFDCTEMCE